MSTKPLSSRVPPHNLEAEMAVLGSLLLGHADAVDRARSLVITEDFYRNAHSEIFAANARPWRPE